MNLGSILILVAVATLVSSGDAVAGHEWTDGTMGPPTARSYDTTMPAFPLKKKTSAKTIEEPSRACDHSVSSSPSSSDAGETVQQELANNKPATNSERSETCRHLAQ